LTQLHWARESRVTGGAPLSERIQLARADFAAGLSLWRLWSMLGWADIRQRYRRSLIGPFWLTISMAVMVAGMGLVYGTLFERSLETFLPFLAAGFLGWLFISATISEGSTVFIAAEGLIKHGGLPLSIHLFRALWRNILILAHNSVVLVVLYAIFPIAEGTSIGMALVGLALTTINLGWIITILGPFCTRFRDLTPIVASVMQLMFFITPIVFHSDSIQKISWIYTYNPLYYMVESIRAPLIGDQQDPAGIPFLIAFAVIGWSVALIFFARVRGRIAFWI
jgi:ABC-type polysaccharide/polyol phosphate export permease